MNRLIRLVLGILPWLTIAGLLTAAFYLQPAGIGNAVTPPPIVPQDRFYGAAYAGQGEVWMVGNQGKIVHSKDGGRSWAIQETGVPVNLQSIVAWDSNRLLAVGDEGTILHTQDGGGDWRQLEIELSGISDKLVRARILKDGNAWIVGEFGTILQFQEKGKEADLAAEPRDMTLHDITEREGERYAVGEFGTVMYSADGGQNWEEQSTPAPGTLNGIDFRSAADGVIVGLDGMILVTDDGGVNWHEVASPTIEHLFAVRWIGDRWLAVGAQGVILESGPAAREWTRRSVEVRDFAWRTDIIEAGAGWLLVGAVSGFLVDDEWHPIRPNEEQGS